MISCSRRYFLSLATSAGAAALTLHSCGSTKKQGRTYADSLVSSCDRIIADGMNSIRDAADKCAETILTRGTCFIAPYSFHHGTVPDIPDLPPLFKIIRSKIMTDAVEAHDIIISAGLQEEITRISERSVPVIVVEALEGDSTRSLKGRAMVSVTGSMPSDGTVSSPFPLTDVLIGSIAGEAYTRSGGIGLIGHGTPETANQYLEVVRNRIMTMNSQSESIHEAATILTGSLRNGGTVHVVDITGLFHRDLTFSAVLPPSIVALPKENIPETHIDSNDCVLYLSMTSGSRVDLTTITRLTANGAPLIALCPHDEDGGFRVYKKAAVSIDNSSPEKTGIIPFDEGRHHFLHTGHIINAAAAWNILAETIRLMSGVEQTA